MWVRELSFASQEFADVGQGIVVSRLRNCRRKQRIDVRASELPMWSKELTFAPQELPM